MAAWWPRACSMGICRFEVCMEDKKLKTCERCGKKFCARHLAAHRRKGCRKK